MAHRARFAIAQRHPRGPRMGSLKSPCRTSYWSSIETIALNCLIFEKTAFFRISGDTRTEGQTYKLIDSIIA